MLNAKITALKKAEKHREGVCLTYSHSHTYTHILTLTYLHSHSHTLTYILSRELSSHTHITHSLHTHSLSLSLLLPTESDERKVEEKQRRLEEMEREKTAIAERLSHTQSLLQAAQGLSHTLKPTHSLSHTHTAFTSLISNVSLTMLLILLSFQRAKRKAKLDWLRMPKKPKRHSLSSNR